MRNVITTELTKVRRIVYLKLLEKITEGDYNSIPKISRELIANGMIPEGMDAYRAKILIDETVKILLGSDYSRTEDMELYELLPSIREILEGKSEYYHDRRSSVVNVIKSICDSCPLPSYYITDLCRNCSAKYCMNSCPKKAISIADGKPRIDHDKCVGCGLCAKSCPYGAIIKTQRPCVTACEANAMSADEQHRASIDDTKCTQCGECAVACPFGAVLETSNLTQVAHSLDTGKAIAIFAPSSVAQFGTRVSMGQLKAALRAAGFSDAMEVAIGADMVGEEEADYVEANIDRLKFIMTSCCPAYKEMILKKFPELAEHISPSLSPMNMLAKSLKSQSPDSIVVFIGPCIAKKHEAEIDEYTDYVLTYEEVAALFAVKGIEPSKMEEIELDKVTSYARGFAAAGGVAEAVKKYASREIETHACSGLKNCIEAMKQAKKGDLTGLIEGMSCEGGCISGTRVMVNPNIALSNLKKIMASQTEKEMV